MTEPAQKRCTRVTLEALGIKVLDGESPVRGAGVLKSLMDHKYVVIWLHTLPPNDTVLTFVLRNPKGLFYISTRGHAMAVVNGKLIDTTERGLDGRKIESAFQVYKKRK